MSIATAFSQLTKELSGVVRLDEPLARYTTYRIGGPADILIIADTLADLKAATAILDASQIEWTVLGKGSNILAADAGYRGAVIILGREFRKHFVREGQLIAGAGAILAHVVQDAYAAGLSGLEFAVGIPGTVGGALAMNAGTGDDWIGSVVSQITVLQPTGELVSVRGHEVAWGYRSATLPARGITVECSLRVEQGDVISIRRRMDSALARRKRTQPIGLPCAGSVFRNPEGDSAGRLIENVGLKGVRSGQASISEVHANFIVNHGGATARDVLRLLHDARDTVLDRHGVELKPEIKFLGSFS